MVKFPFFFPALVTPNSCVELNTANGRDLKGWNPAAIAVFHESKGVLELLLAHGGDPYLKSSYNKTAWDMAQDDLDAAGRVVRSRCEAGLHAGRRFAHLCWWRNQGFGLRWEHLLEPMRSLCVTKSCSLEMGTHASETFCLRTINVASEDRPVSWQNRCA